jgi:hypothetical protein
MAGAVAFVVIAVQMGYQIAHRPPVTASLNVTRGGQIGAVGRFWVPLVGTLLARPALIRDDGRPLQWKRLETDWVVVAMMRSPAPAEALKRLWAVANRQPLPRVLWLVMAPAGAATPTGADVIRTHGSPRAYARLHAAPGRDGLTLYIVSPGLKARYRGVLGPEAGSPTLQAAAQEIRRIPDRSS